LGEKNEYSSKLYNILGLAILRSGKLNADKIFKKGFSELKETLSNDDMCFL